MEFVMLTPLLLIVLMLTFQIALIVQAKFVVNYAAFCAARSAIVVIPTAVESSVTGKLDAENQINTNDPDSPKMHIIRRAAALACAGISPPLSSDIERNSFINPAPPGITALRVVTLFPSIVPGPSMPAQFLLRSPYALAASNTTVAVQAEKHSGSADQASYQLITTKVIYRYYLTVPIANWLFGTSFGFLSGYYIPIHEQYTLPSETDSIFPPGQQPPGANPLTEAYE